MQEHRTLKSKFVNFNNKELPSTLFVSESQLKCLIVGLARKAVFCSVLLYELQIFV